MKRTYLEEDLNLIRSYFPGARTVNLRTPFDLTERGRRLPRLASDTFHEARNPHETWSGGASWTN